MGRLYAKFSVGEEGTEEFLVLALFGDGRLDCLAEVLKILGNEVWQVSVFGVIPALFRRVQFGTVGWQELEMEPTRMMLLEVGCRRPMHVPAIPDDDHRATVMMMQLPKQPDHLVGIDVFR